MLRPGPVRGIHNKNYHRYRACPHLLLSPPRSSLQGDAAQQQPPDDAMGYAKCFGPELHKGSENSEG